LFVNSFLLATPTEQKIG